MKQKFLFGLQVFTSLILFMAIFIPHGVYPAFVMGRV